MGDTAYYIHNIWKSGRTRPPCPLQIASMMSRHGDADVTDNGRLLLQLCCNNTLFIMKTFPTQRRVKVHLVHRFLGSTATHWFLHSFSWPVPFSVGRSCQKSVELPTHEYLVVCNLAYVLQNQKGLHNRAGPRGPTKKVWGPDGQRCDKNLCRQRIVLVPGAPGMHSGRGDGVAAV